MVIDTVQKARFLSYIEVKSALFLDDEPSLGKKWKLEVEGIIVQRLSLRFGGGGLQLIS